MSGASVSRITSAPMLRRIPRWTLRTRGTAPATSSVSEAALSRWRSGGDMRTEANFYFYYSVSRQLPVWHHGGILQLPRAGELWRQALRGWRALSIHNIIYHHNYNYHNYYHNNNHYHNNNKHHNNDHCFYYNHTNNFITFYNFSSNNNNIYNDNNISINSIDNSRMSNSFPSKPEMSRECSCWLLWHGGLLCLLALWPWMRHQCQGKELGSFLAPTGTQEVTLSLSQFLSSLSAVS